jgi:hypothetical protein
MHDKTENAIPYQLILCPFMYFYYPALILIKEKLPYLLEYFENTPNSGSKARAKKYKIRYTNVEPKFLIRILVEKPFSSKKGLRAVSSATS